MPRQPIAIVFGGTRIGNRDLFMPGHALNQFFDILTAHNISTIDTAQSYGNSEATIGQVGGGNKFTIDTKWSPLWDEPNRAWATKDHITKSAVDSIQKLQINKVDIFYLHRPDANTPISETLSAVNDVYQRGLFWRFGLSGFPAFQVEMIYNHCIENGYPPPVVYQGSYNPLSRDKEKALFPTLRKLGISFYTYGPSAGGFFGKSVSQAEEMAQNGTYVSATCRPYIGNRKFLDALSRWNAAAEDEGVSGAELAYRWVAYHSILSRDNGDAMVIGASSPEQLETTLNGIDKGPLSEQVCAAVDDIWASIKGKS